MIKLFKIPPNSIWCDNCRDNEFDTVNFTGTEFRSCDIYLCAKCIGEAYSILTENPLINKDATR